MSYSLNTFNTNDNCDLSNSQQPLRYYLLSVYPDIELDQAGTIKKWDQKADRLKFTVQSEFINDEFDFSLPETTEKTVRPIEPPSRKKIGEYEESFFIVTEAVEGEETGASYFAAASASLITLAALTLY